MTGSSLPGSGRRSFKQPGTVPEAAEKAKPRVLMSRQFGHGRVRVVSDCCGNAQAHVLCQKAPVMDTAQWKLHSDKMTLGAALAQEALDRLGLRACKVPPHVD